MNNAFKISTIGDKITDFIELNKLGNGQFGTVYKMKSKMNSQIYAVKFVPISRDKYENVKQQREKFIMSNIFHPNIVKLYTTFQDFNNLYLVSEFVEGTNLESYVKDFKKNNPNKYINQNLVISILKQILFGLKYLHGMGILHRDIKPDNILIDTNNNIKITDFGISAMYNKEWGYLSSNNTRVGRPDYVCPEILNNKPYDFKCDIFSLGYTIYYVMNFCLPSKTNVYCDQNVKRISSDKINRNYNIKLVELIKKMYRDNPQERPDTTQAQQELELIEKSINNINLESSFNIPIDNKFISSMNCILQCFFDLDNINSIKNMVINKLKNKNINDIFFPLFFFNFFEVIDKRRKNKINKIEYNNKLKYFVQLLCQKNPSINGKRPVILYHNILSLFKEEFNSFIDWTNKMNTFNYSYPYEYPENRFPDIYKNINDFQKIYRNPLVDIFYFIIIIAQKCPNCGFIFNAYSQIASFLPLYNKYQNNIINLIQNYLRKTPINQFIQCGCGYSGSRVEEKVFFNTPDYLVLDLDEGGEVTFDYQIDLSQYIKTSLGPRRYELYAVINTEIDFNSNVHFICSIKNKDFWTFYSGDNIQKCGNECLGVGIPSCAIYKKLN